MLSGLVIRKYKQRRSWAFFFYYLIQPNYNSIHDAGFTIWFSLNILEENPYKSI